MRIRFLNSSPGEGQPRHFVTTYVVNDMLAVDAGCLGFLTPIERQQQIRHVLLSHSHIDHVGSLPLFLEIAAVENLSPPTVYANAETLDCLRRDVFNGRLWPNLLDCSAPEFVRLKNIEDGQSLQIDGLLITAVAVDHTVPTLAYFIADDTAAVLVTGDTGPTSNVWEVARSVPNLRAVFLEAAFPNSMQWLADLSRHLTPATFAGEARKLPPTAGLITVHVKPRFHTETVNELMQLGLPLEVGVPGREYVF